MLTFSLIMVRSYTNQRPSPALTGAHNCMRTEVNICRYGRGEGTNSTVQHTNNEISFRAVIAVQKLLILNGFLQIHNYRKANPHHKAVKTIFTQS